MKFCTFFSLAGLTKLGPRSCLAFPLLNPAYATVSVIVIVTCCFWDFVKSKVTNYFFTSVRSNCKKITFSNLPITDAMLVNWQDRWNRDWHKVSTDDMRCSQVSWFQCVIVLGKKDYQYESVRLCELMVQWKRRHPPFWCCVMVSEGAVEVYQEGRELLYRIGLAWNLYTCLRGMDNGGGLAGWWQRCFFSLDTRSDQPGVRSSRSTGCHQQGMGPMLLLHTPIIVGRGLYSQAIWLQVDSCWCFNG